MKAILIIFSFFAVLIAYAGTWVKAGSVLNDDDIRQFLLAANGNNVVPYALTNEGIINFDGFNQPVYNIPFYNTKDAGNSNNKRLVSDACGNLYLFAAKSEASAGYALYRYVPAAAQWQTILPLSFESDPESIQALNNYTLGASTENNDFVALMQNVSNPEVTDLVAVQCYENPVKDALPWRILQKQGMLSYKNLQLLSSSNQRYSYFFSSQDVNFIDPLDFGAQASHFIVWDKGQDHDQDSLTSNSLYKAMLARYPSINAHVLISSATEDAQGNVYALVSYWHVGGVNHDTVPSVDLWEYQPQGQGASVWSYMDTVFHGGQHDFANVSTAITTVKGANDSGPIVYFAVVPEIAYDDNHNKITPSEVPVYGYLAHRAVNYFHAIIEPVNSNASQYANMSVAMGRFYQLGHDLYLFDTNKHNTSDLPAPLWVLKNADDFSAVAGEQWLNDTDAVPASPGTVWPALPSGTSIRPNTLLVPRVTKDGRLYALSDYYNKDHDRVYDVWRYTQ